MVESTFSKVTATTSMTNYERRNARKRAQAARKGATQPAPDPASTKPRREGLRGVRLAFFHDEPPRRVVPRTVSTSRPQHIPIPRLKGQEGMWSHATLYLRPVC